MPTIVIEKCQLEVSISFGRDPRYWHLWEEGKAKALSSFGFYCQGSFSRGNTDSSGCVPHASPKRCSMHSFTWLTNPAMELRLGTGHGREQNGYRIYILMGEKAHYR